MLVEVPSMNLQVGDIIYISIYSFQSESKHRNRFCYTFLTRTWKRMTSYPVTPCFSTRVDREAIVSFAYGNMRSLISPDEQYRRRIGSKGPQSAPAAVFAPARQDPRWDPSGPQLAVSRDFLRSSGLPYLPVWRPVRRIRGMPCSLCIDQSTNVSLSAQNLLLQVTQLQFTQFAYPPFS